MGSLENVPAVYVIDPYHPKAIEELQQHDNGFELILPTSPGRNNYLERAWAILVRSDTSITAEDFERAGNQLRYIIKQGVGVDNIDLHAATQRGIKVFNTPGINAESVAELTLGLAFNVARRISEFHLRIYRGEKISRSRNLGTSLYKKTIGVIGMGAIGRQVAKKWIGSTEGRVLGYDPFAPDGAWTDVFGPQAFTRTTELEHLLRNSDVVSLHVPELPTTRNMLSHKQFAMMREGSILLNCARGGLIDETALLQALESGHLTGAGLDAVSNEPVDHLNYGTTLLAHPRVVITPHVGASTEENQLQSGLMAVEILLDLLEGGPASQSRVALNESGKGA